MYTCYCRCQARSNACRGRLAKEPMFCFESAIKLFFWSCLMYEDYEGVCPCVCPVEAAASVKLCYLQCYIVCCHALCHAFLMCHTVAWGQGDPIQALWHAVITRHKVFSTVSHALTLKIVWHTLSCHTLGWLLIKLLLLSCAAAGARCSCWLCCFCACSNTGAVDEGALTVQPHCAQGWGDSVRGLAHRHVRSRM